MNTTDRDSANFVDFCYRTILQREPDDGGRSDYVSALDAGRLTREGLLLEFICSDEFRELRKHYEHVPPGHFFSAIPSDDDRERYLRQTAASNGIAGVELNEVAQVQLVNEIKVFHDQCEFPEEQNSAFRYWFRNPAFSYSDGIVLQAMMRHFRPRRIVEIGSGFSSCVMLDTRERFLPDTQLTFIEPYPELLISLLKDGDLETIRLIDSPVQEAKASIFEELEAGDILFVDSTHVVKLMSDVNHIFFDIVPKVRPGVVVHFHDIFWPFDYPKEWIIEKRAWNEAYLLRAFLQYNAEFEIIFFGSYLHQRHTDEMVKLLPKTRLNAGGSIWIRRLP